MSVQSDLSTQAVIYSEEDKPSASEVILLFRRAGLNGPLDEPERIAQMLEAAQQIITARIDGRLVGLIRVLTDFSFNAFIADLAVSPSFQQKGIGAELLARATASNDGVKYILQTHDSGDFYLKRGFVPAEHCYVRMRTR
jgi:N-acetylglutamate synthase-like GNAT family acetyltransferase